MDMNKGIAGAEDDLEMERRLAKKLKVKGQKLKPSNDGIDELLDGLLDDEKTMDRDISDDEKAMKPTKKRKKKASSQSSTKESEDGGRADEVGADVVLDEMPEREEEVDTVGNKEDTCTVNVSTKYVAPHLRACANKESEELAQVRRRIRGLLFFLSANA